MKKLGYTMAHIWACPPSEGDDYIFHSHPAEQKIPKPKRLQEWYKKMLDKGIIERIVLDYKDIYKQVKLYLKILCFATTHVVVPGHCYEKFCFENILYFRCK